MSNIQTDLFLSGQGIAVELGAIERTLLDLWEPAAAERVGASESELPPVTRVVLANLVVETTPDEAVRVAQALDVIVARFPCRAIVMVRDAAPGRELRAEVAALCHLPAPGLPQVCSERILLRAGSDALDLLAGAVRPLLEPDMPMILWWTSDPRAAEPLFRDLSDEATRVLIDIEASDRDALALGLDPTINPFSRDTAWFGLTGWRDLIAQCFDVPGRLEMLGRLTRVEIKAVTPVAGGTCRQALWLAAWLAGQLRWTFDPTTGGFDTPAGPVALSIETTHDPAAAEPRVTGVGLAAPDEDGESTFHIERPKANDSAVRVLICSSTLCEMSRLVRLRDTDAARRVSAGLESARNDLPFQRALPIFLTLLARAGSA